MTTDPIGKLMVEFDAAVVADPIKQPHVRENFKATLEYEFDALRAEVESLRADAERLTYLDGDEMKHVFKIGKTWYCKPGYRQPHRKAKTLRVAIDAAIESLVVARMRGEGK